MSFARLERLPGRKRRKGSEYRCRSGHPSDGCTWRDFPVSSATARSVVPPTLKSVLPTETGIEVNRPRRLVKTGRCAVSTGKCKNSDLLLRLPLIDLDWYGLPEMERWTWDRVKSSGFVPFNFYSGTVSPFALFEPAPVTFYLSRRQNPIYFLPLHVSDYTFCDRTAAAAFYVRIYALFAAGEQKNVCLVSKSL